MGSTPVAIVDGTGGAGKTTLVVHWAHRIQNQFPDGTLFVNLRGYGPSAPLSADLVLASFLSAVGVPKGEIPDDLNAQAGLYRSWLAGRRVLVILDNAANTEQVRPLVPGSSRCMVVVTSRASLTDLVITEAAHRISLDLFTTAEAQTLLRGIVGPARVDAEPAAAADLVQMCAGLPMSLRVAATRIATHTDLDLADVVADLIDERVPNTDDSIPGFRSAGDAVRSVIDWSYTRLSFDQARLFRMLGLHPGSEFGAPAIIALTGMSRVAVYRFLEDLVELNLVERVGRKRYRMHDLLYAYAADRAHHEDTDETCREANERALTWYAATACQADQAAFPAQNAITLDSVSTFEADLTFEDPTGALAWLDSEQSNLLTAVRQAAECHRHELTAALAASSRFLTFRARHLARLFLEFTELGAKATRASGNQVGEIFLLNQRADTLQYLGRLDEADVTSTRALALAQQVGDRVGQVAGLAGLGGLRRAQNRLPEARDHYQRMLHLAQVMGRTRSAAVAHCNLSQICTDLGNYQQALVHADLELELRKQSNDRTGEAFALHDAALAWRGLQEYDTAIKLCRQAIGIYQEWRYARVSVVGPMLTLADLLDQAGDYVAAATTLRQAIELLTQFDDPRAPEARQRLADVESRTIADNHP